MTVCIKHVCYDHMPDESERPVRAGQTLRQALKALRKAGRHNFGNIGGMTAKLCDNTCLDVSLKPCEGGMLMNSQRISRTVFMDWRELVIRRYKW